jgi:hypothetical protein
MLRIVFFIAAAAFTGAAAAQYKWVDQNGRVQYGDTPPPGVKYQPLRSSPGPLPQPEASDRKDNSPKGPLTNAEKDAEFRKRKQETEQDRQKQAKAQQEAEDKRDNCARAKEYLRALESGQRVSRTDAKGEPYVMEDAQRSQESAKARQSVQQWCN